jgi:hypothetical protein
MRSVFDEALLRGRGQHPPGKENENHRRICGDEYGVAAHHETEFAAIFDIAYAMIERSLHVLV